MPVIRRLDEEELERRIGPVVALSPSYVRRDSWSDEENFAYLKPANPPKFRKLLKSLSLIEGSKAYLECTVTPTNDPDLKVEWFKDGIELLNGSRIKIIFEFGFCVLEFDDCWVRDVGVYTCRATNKFGFDEIQCSIAVGKTSSLINDSQLPEDMRAGFEHCNYLDSIRGQYQETTDTVEEQGPPVMVQIPEPIDAIEGSGAKFLCRVHGNPTPKVHWFKDDQLISESKRMLIYFDGIHCLEIPKTRTYDSGKISVIARNVHGESRHDTQLTVNERPTWGNNLKSVQKSFTDSEVKRNLGINVRASNAEESPELKEAFQRARVNRPLATTLRNLETGKEDSTLNSIINVLGYKNKNELSEIGGRMKEVPKKLDEIVSTDMSAATAAMALQENSGGPNSGPQTNGSTALDTNGYDALNQNFQNQNQQQPQNQQQQQQQPKDEAKPKFVQVFTDTSVADGQPASFSVQVSGAQPINVRWFLGSTEIRPNSPGFQITANGDVHSLTVKRVTGSFSGNIMCALKNQVGDTSHAAKLSIASKQGQPQQPGQFQQPNQFQQPGAQQPGQQPNQFQQPGQAPSQFQQPGQAPSQFQQPGQAPSQFQQPGAQQTGQPPNQFQQPGAQQPGQVPIQFQQPGQPPAQFQQPSGQQQSAQQPRQFQQPGQPPMQSQQQGQQPGQFQQPTQQPGQFQQPTQQPGQFQQPTQQPGQFQQPIQQPGQFQQPTQQPGQFQQPTQQPGQFQQPTQQPGQFQQPTQQPGQFQQQPGQFAPQPNAQVPQTAQRLQMNQPPAFSQQPGGGPQQVPPTFLRGMKDTTASSGENVIFEVEVVGTPTPKVSFHLNSVLLKSGPRTKIEVTGRRHKLIVTNSRMSDVGIYECRLASPLGTQTSSARLTINAPVQQQQFNQGPQAQSQNPAFNPNFQQPQNNYQPPQAFQQPPQQNFQQPPQQNVQQPPQQNFQQPPHQNFQQQPSFQQAPQQPQQNFQQQPQQQNFQQPPQQNFQQQPQFGGPAQPTTVVQVPLSDNQAVAGQQFTLSCQIANAKASVKWTKNGTNLQNSNQIMAHNGPNGVYNLTLKNPTAADAGYYTCFAVNTNPPVTTGCNLYIVPPMGGALL